MDIKEHALLIELLSRVHAFEFDERDVLALLILLRRHADKRASLVSELGHFIAHRERDQGLLLTFMKSVKQALSPGATLPAFFSAPVSVPALHGQLAALLTDLSLPPVTLAHTECLTVIMSTLLHGIQFSVTGERHWSLQFGFNADLVGLFGVVPVGALITFPVMATTNRFFASPFATPDTYWFPTRGFVVSSSCTPGGLTFAQTPAA